MAGDGQYFYDAPDGTVVLDLVILDARNFEVGQQAGIRLPHVVPPGFNGNWVQGTR